MDIEQFTDKKTGSLTRVSSSSGEVWAFVPDELPTDWEFSAELWPLLVDAMTALASLSSIGRYLPSAELLRLPLHWHEAQRSSNLEGTFTSPEQQILFDIGHKTETRDEDAGDLKEVSNYTDALMARERDFAGLPLSLRLIRGCMRFCCVGCEEQTRSPGSFVVCRWGLEVRFDMSHRRPLTLNHCCRILSNACTYPRRITSSYGRSYCTIRLKQFTRSAMGMEGSEDCFWPC